MLTVISSTQILHIVRRCTAQALGIPIGRVRIIKPYIGGYSDYAEALQQESAQQAQPIKAKPVAAAKPAEEPAKKKMTYGERLELERLDQEIARSEAELKMLGAEINQCGSDFTRLADLTKQQEGVQQKLDEMVERWAYLSELAEAED